MTARPSSIDLNADLGEGFGPWRMGDDAALLRIVTSANVACGFHAGDPDIMSGVFAQAREAGVDALVTVGDLAVHAGPAWGGEEFVAVENAGQAAARIGEIVEPGDTVLVKGSRGVGLEVVTEALVAERGPIA